MAYESLEPYRERIETMLAAGDSVSAIAKKLGIPEKRRLISKFKQERFDVRAAARASMDREIELATRQKFKGAVVAMADEHEGVNLGMRRGIELLGIDAGDEYPYPVASALWAEGMRIFSSAVKLKMEIAGEDSGSVVAESFLELVKLANRRRPGLGNADSMPE